MAFIDAGSATVLHSALSPVLPNYLRVERRGDTWTYRYSANGTYWFKAVEFDQTLVVTESGISTKVGGELKQSQMGGATGESDEADVKEQEGAVGGAVFGRCKIR